MKKIQLLSAMLCSTALIMGGCGSPDENTTNPILTGATATMGETGGGEEGTATTTTGSTATTSATTGTTDASTGTTFVTNDMAMSCGTMCDPWNPVDCPMGEKCTAVACEVGSNSWDSNVCVPVMGTKVLGDDCQYLGGGIDGLDDCGPGLMCWDQNPDTMLGSCIEFCSGSPTAPTCPGGNGICAIANDGVLPICLPQCDPLAPACTNPDNVCIPDTSDTGFICVLNASGDMGPYGTPCNFANSCNQGLLCIDATAVPEPDCAAATGCCSPICDTTQPNSCPGTGQVCEPWYDPTMSVPPGYENVGICAVPV